MKTFFALIIFSLLSAIASAQEQISSQTLDSLSSLISHWQMQCDGIIRNLPNGEKEELRFPKENFKLWYYNNLATHAVQTTTGQQEQLELTEDIDLSKAISIQLLKSRPENSSKIHFNARIKFPDNALQTQIYENGKLVKTQKRSYLNIVHLATSDEKSEVYKAYLSITYTINLLKKNKKQINLDVAEINGQMLSALETDTEENYNKFLNRFPQSIFTETVKSKLAGFQEMRNKKQADIKYIDDFMAKFKVKKELTENTIFHEIPEAGFLQNMKNGSCEYVRKFRKKEIPVAGPYRITRTCYSVGDPRLSSYSYIMFVSESQQEVLTERDKLIEEFKKNIDNRWIEKDAEGARIFSPKGVQGMRIFISHGTYDRYNKWFYYTVSFYDFIKP